MNYLKRRNFMGQGSVVAIRKQRGLKANIESIREKAEGSVSTQSHRPGARVNTLEGPEFSKSTFLLECLFPIWHSLNLHC